MNQNSRAFKILSKVKPTITPHPQMIPQTNVSTAIQNLQQECLLAAEVLKENIDPNLEKEDLLTEIIEFNNTNDLEALIDIDGINNITIPEEEENIYQDNVREEATVGSELAACNNSIASLSSHFVQETQNKSVTTEDQIEVEANLDKEAENISGEDLFESESNSKEEEIDFVLENKSECNEETKGSAEENENLDQNNKKRKREKNRLSDSRKWEYNTNKSKREQGSSYMGRKQNKFVIPINKRIMKVRCSCTDKKSKTKSSIECYKINDEERQRIFQKFWTFSWQEKKMYVLGRTIASDTKRARNRKFDDKSRRTVSYAFYMDKKKERIRVCKTMFCNTLGISMRTVTDWLHKGLTSPETEKPTDNVETKTQNLHKKPLRNNDKKMSVTEFLNSLPKLESHYCRKSSTRLYLEPRWKSKAELYALYKDSWCKEKQIEAASLTIFKYLFEEMSLSLFSPKKDECDICVGYRTKNIGEEIYQEHVLKKDEARDEKQKDKESLDNIVFTMDLQSILLCPQSNVSALYYKTKLIIHNFTIFNLHSKDGYCFVWHEGEGELKSHCFASIICNFLATKVLPNIDPENKPNIIFYSDGCGAQNRNTILANALLNLAIENNICIIQKYLEKGHTQMECDSMHSTIERKISGRVINVPADYVYYLKTARQQPRPYEVQYLYHDYFKKFSEINFVSSIRPGKKVGDPTVQNIRALKYNPNGSIEYKLRHSDNFQLLPVRLNKQTPIPVQKLPRLYRGKLKIKREKFDHLQSLKNTLEQDYHNFYDTLEHE